MNGLASSTSVLLVQGADRGLRARVGAIVSLTVREKLSPGLYRVALGSTLLKAGYAGELAAGSAFRAKVELLGGSIVLRLEKPRLDLASILAQVGLPADPGARLALGALLREGSPAEPGSIQRLRRLAQKIGATGGMSLAGEDALAMAARLESKGIPATEELVDLLGSGGSGGDPAQGGDSSPERKEGHKGDSGQSQGLLKSQDTEPMGVSTGDVGSGQDNAHAEEGRFRVPDAHLEGSSMPPQVIETSCDESELPALLGSLLRDSSLAAGGEGSLLSLFNHLRGPEGSWVSLPFSFSLDLIAFDGSFRVKLPYVPRGPFVIEAVFSSSGRGGKHDWRARLFCESKSRSRLLLEVEGLEALRKARALLPRFEKELSAWGCAIELRPHAEGKDEPGGLDIDA